jgi:gamma-glutamylcyclotransferase (GGCT)/AIG2-like uncharacterized protein YtfP
MTHRVFVYGTLKKGLHNHYLLQDSEFFGGAVTVPTYSMISVGLTDAVTVPGPGRSIARRRR